MLFGKNYRHTEKNPVKDQDLLLIHIAPPDIMGSTIEVIRKYRFAWNASWLQEKKELK